MTFFKKIGEYFLNRSNSFNYYKTTSESVKFQVEELKDMHDKDSLKIKELKDYNKELTNKNKNLTNENKKLYEKISEKNNIIYENKKEKEKYSEKLKNYEITISTLSNQVDTLNDSENKYYKSLLHFEIEKIEKNLFELISMQINENDSFGQNKKIFKNQYEIIDTLNNLSENINNNRNNYKYLQNLPFLSNEITVNYWNNEDIFENSIGKTSIRLSENEILTINEIIEKLKWNRNERHKYKSKYEKIIKSKEE